QPGEQGADARPVHLDADEVLLRRGLGHLQQRLAHAEADLQGARGAAPEACVEIEQAIVQGQAEQRPALFQAALLTGGGAPGTHHETLDGAKTRRLLRRAGLLVAHAVPFAACSPEWLSGSALPAARTRWRKAFWACGRPGRPGGRPRWRASWPGPSAPAAGRGRWRCSSAPRRNPSPWRWWRPRRCPRRRRPGPAPAPLRG